MARNDRITIAVIAFAATVHMNRMIVALFI
jgi:hypothetical protein